MNALQVSELYKIYKDGGVETVALRGANLNVHTGEFIAISGRSGAGKTTLLNLLGGLAMPSAGKIIIGDADITKMDESERAAFRRKTIGIIYQSDNLIPFLTALENVMLPMELAGKKGIAIHARQLLSEVGLAQRINHKPAMLSGGERQRVAIAIALANHPQILLADELTGELDSTTAASIMDLLNRLNTEYGLTLVIVTHNKNVATWANRQVKIDDGQLFESETSHV
jgi:putative ABC transport system ATP-binding protein